MRRLRYDEIERFEDICTETTRVASEMNMHSVVIGAMDDVLDEWCIRRAMFDSHYEAVVYAEQVANKMTEMKVFYTTYIDGKYRGARWNY